MTQTLSNSLIVLVFWFSPAQVWQSVPESPVNLSETRRIGVWQGRILQEWLAELGTLDAKARYQAVRALAKPQPDATPADAEVAVLALRKAMGDQDPGISCEASKGLLHLGPAAIPALTRLLVDRDETVRSTAAAALGMHGRKARAALPALRQALRSAKGVEEALLEEAIMQIEKDTAQAK